MRRRTLRQERDQRETPGRERRAGPPRPLPGSGCAAARAPGSGLPARPLLPGTPLWARRLGGGGMGRDGIGRDSARLRAGPGPGPGRWGPAPRLRALQPAGPRSPGGRPASRPRRAGDGPFPARRRLSAALGTASLLWWRSCRRALPASAALQRPRESLVRSYSIFAILRGGLCRRGGRNGCRGVCNVLER